jgi:hypothetical protein
MNLAIERTTKSRGDITREKSFPSSGVSVSRSLLGKSLAVSLSGTLDKLGRLGTGAKSETSNSLVNGGNSHTATTGGKLAHTGVSGKNGSGSPVTKNRLLESMLEDVTSSGLETGSLGGRLHLSRSGGDIPINSILKSLAAIGGNATLLAEDIAGKISGGGFRHTVSAAGSSTALNTVLKRTHSALGNNTTPDNTAGKRADEVFTGNTGARGRKLREIGHLF